MAAGVSLLSDLPYTTSSSANSRESNADMEPGIILLFIYLWLGGILNG